jgi:ubiquinone/menaquinone biosynthesis C-methylase UbiE
LPSRHDLIASEPLGCARDRRSERGDLPTGHPPRSLRWLIAFLRFFFRHLYTTWAWAYDAVAWTTSMGQWSDWVAASIEALPDGRVLELGHGPGHLLLTLSRQDRQVYGLDPSPQMGRIAQARLARGGYPSAVVRARAQRLPFPPQSFDGLVSTFPSEFIVDPETLAEMSRVLRPSGRLIVVPLARITGRALPDRVAGWLYRITLQSGDLPQEWLNRFERAGFEPQIERVALPRAEVIRVRAAKR